jgi:undecaprenyl-phosphate 4-deoxy-4-formamido-L-arabinose transferase
MPRPSIDRPCPDPHCQRGYGVSIVIPVYRGETTVGRLVHKLVDALGREYDLEIVLVDDGSPDDSARVCRELADEFSQVRFVGLSKNYGEHNAVMAGLNHAGGDCVVIMDDDFQNPPEEVGRLVEELRRGYDVVFTYYEKKRHSWLRNLGSRFNNFVASLLLNKPRDLYLSSFKAMSRFAVDELVKYTGPYPYIDGLLLRFTRNYSRVLVRHDPRAEGRSGYTLGKLVGLWLNMFTSFSVLPLRLASCAGFFFAFLGLVGAGCFAVEKLRHPDLPVGWASLIVSLFVVSGVQLFALGMIGEYLGRLFLKETGQPQFVVRERYHCQRQNQARTRSEAA